MNKKFLSLTLIALFTFSLTSCRTEIEPPALVETPSEDVEVIEEQVPEPIVHLPGTLPLEYPTVETTAQAEDWVLAPSKSMLDDAWKFGVDGTVFVFHSAKMVEPGAVESTIEDRLGTQIVVPNSVIIPIKPGQIAQPGDILLTWWQYGSGLQKAIVQEGGAEPVVRYLDDFANKEDTLKPNSFHTLKEEFEPGISVAIKHGEVYDNGTIVNLSQNKALVSGFSGSLQVFDKENLIPIPLQINIKEGDKFYGPVIGKYEPITVKSINPAIGQVVGGYQFAGVNKEKNFFFSEITKSL